MFLHQIKWYQWLFRFWIKTYSDKQDNAEVCIASYLSQDEFQVNTLVVLVVFIMSSQSTNTKCSKSGLVYGTLPLVSN